MSVRYFEALYTKYVRRNFGQNICVKRSSNLIQKWKYYPYYSNNGN